MARPKKNNADYFSHESEMRNDVKIKALRRKFSHTGYAVWNYLLEVLTDAEGFCTNWKELDIELYAADFDLDTAELTEIVNYCLKLGLLQLSNGKLYCENLTSSFESLMNKRGRNSTNPRVSEAETTQNESFGSRNPLNPRVSEAETHIVEKSKVEYSKEDYSSPRTREGASAPSEEEKEGIYKIFFWRNIVDPDGEYRKFLEHNSQYGWKLNNTPGKRAKAAREWVPESKGKRVSDVFLDVWSELYERIKKISPEIARDMLDAGSRLSVNNGAIVIHARKSVQNFLANNPQPEIMKLAAGNPVRFSWP